ncbi:MAG TPA: UDP-glucose 4-epimerase GalE [Bacteroidia bacterium]|nr:UDP-glucose 4-epimerase GalE [Bacteroidia bacterium]
MKNNKKVLVTGGTGFIGSHTVVELISKGYEVIIADDLSNSRQEVVDSIAEITGVKPAFVKINLCNESQTRDLFNTIKPDAVVHFAAKKLVGESVLNPINYYSNNLISLLNVTRFCLESGCRNFVFSSSCTVYGQPDLLPVNEEAPRKPAESPYGNTKMISEDILSDTVKISDLRVISLRYFNPVGAHHSALIGEYPLGAPANLMPVLTQSAIGKRPSFHVFGTDYNTPDGSCIRDYIHVVDVAKAHVTALDRLFENNEKASINYFNLGTGVGISVLEMIHCFEKVNNLKLNYILAPRRPGDVEKVWADTSKANKVLGWKAEKSIEEMVSSAWAWEQKLHEKISL